MKRLRFCQALLGLPVLVTFFYLSLASAEEVAVEYQVLSEVRTPQTITWSVRLEIRDLAGKPLSKLSIDLHAPLFASLSQQAVYVGTVTTYELRILTADFTFNYDQMPQQDGGTLLFIINYETISGVPRIAVIRGRPVVETTGGTP